MRWIVATFIVWLIATKRWDKWFALATTGDNSAQVAPPGSNGSTPATSPTPWVSMFGGALTIGPTK